MTMNKKKILVWETLSTVSGGQKMTLTILDMLADKYEFCCLIPSEGILSKELSARGIQYILMGDQSLPTGIKGKKAVFQYGVMTLRSIRKSIKAIKKYDPDILYSPGPAALPWSAICGVLCKKPVVWHLHHVFLDGPTKKLINFCSKWRAVDTIIAVSECVGNQIRNAEGRNKVKILYNPVDFDKYSNGDRERIIQEIETHFGSIDGHIILGHVALVQNEKKQSLVLDIIKRLDDEGKKVRGLFPGECRDQSYLEELNNKANKYSLSEKVWFMGRRNDIPDLLKVIDVLIIPSSEGFPLAGLEAAAAGVPVAACNIAGAEEFIQVSGDGFCFEEDSASSAVEAIKKIIVDREKMIDSGKNFASAKTYPRYKEEIKAVFDCVEKR